MRAPTMLDRFFADCPQEYFELLPEWEICRLEMETRDEIKLDMFIKEVEGHNEKD